MHSNRHNTVTYFASTNHRNKRTFFGVKRLDRLSHCYVIGKTGTGKTTLLETLILQDIHNGDGLTVIDPHGDMVERLAARIPEQRRKDVIYFNVPDPRQRYGYNPVGRVTPGYRAVAASGILEIFRKHWGEKAWGQRMEYILRNAVLAILDQPEATLLDVLRLLWDDAFRKEAAQNIQNEPVKRFWLYEYPKYNPRYRAEAIAPIQSKIGSYVADPVLLKILTEPEQSIDFRRVLDDGKILLVNLAKGKLGEDSAALLGSLLVTTIGLAAFSRAGMEPSARRYHWLYLDEFQSFTTLSVANMLSELRKYHVGMFLAHQYLHQLEPDIRYAVLGNAGTLISFRLGAPDATYIAKEFYPKFLAEDLLNLPNHQVYLKLMIDGAPSKPFSAATMRPQNRRSSVIRIERQHRTKPPVRMPDFPF